MSDEKAPSSGSSHDVERPQAQTRFTTTYRLSHVPSSFTRADIRKLFEKADQELIRDPISLANSVYMSEANEKVATITFLQPPKSVHGLDTLGPYSALQMITSADAGNHNIQLDNHFEGLTPLNDPEPQSITVDIVACTGLAAGAFVGWQHASGNMWLRDFLSNDIPGVRIFIWGRRSQLHKSSSHMSVSHYCEILLNDLDKIRQTSAEKSRPLILMGHSLGGILAKAAFVKASQTEAYSALRDTTGGLVFFGTPHVGIRNNDWAEIWGDEPSGILIHDLAPGSSFLRELGESFKKHLLQERILTIFEHQESHTIFRKEDGKLDRKGKPILRIDEEAACLRVANERCVGINEDHSKIAKLQNDEGSPYHTIKDELRDLVSHASELVFLRIRRKSMLGILLGLQAYFQHLLRTSTPNSVLPHTEENQQTTTLALCMAESSETNALCSVLDQSDHVWLGLKPPRHSIITASQAAERLRDLFSAAIVEASSYDGALRNQLNKAIWTSSLSPGDLTGPILATTSMRVQNLLNAAVSLILDLKESLSAALSAQDPSILRAFIASDQARFLGLHLVVQRRELLNQADVPLAQPSAGRVVSISEQNGLSIGTFYAEDGLTSGQFIIEYRSYKTTESDRLTQQQKKTASKELAAILRDASFNAHISDPVRRRLAPTMSIFEFKGYVDDTQSERLIFLYRIPVPVGLSIDEMIRSSMSLDLWIRNTGSGEPFLEERFAVAYHLSHTVFIQHISGWVHKSIRPENVILVPNPYKGFEHIKRSKIYTHIPYLKGFELSRKIELASDRRPALDYDSDVYRHPNRRGNDIFIQFRPVHDLYALGVLLIEIGTGKSIMTSIKVSGVSITSKTLEDHTMRIAKEKLPKSMGIRYTECALRCLQGYDGFQGNIDSKDDTSLIFAFREFVVDELKRMAAACGYSV